MKYENKMIIFKGEVVRNDGYYLLVIVSFADTIC